MITSIRLASKTKRMLDYLASHTGYPKADCVREIIAQRIGEGQAPLLCR